MIPLERLQGSACKGVFRGYEEVAEPKYRYFKAPSQYPALSTEIAQKFRPVAQTTAGANPSV